MRIVVGQSIEDHSIYHIDKEGIHINILVKDLFAQSRVVVFGGPAPFSRLDTEQAELYESHTIELLNNNIDKVFCIYPQDAFVVNRFKKDIKEKVGSNLIEYYADGDGFFTNGYNLVYNYTAHGLAHRSVRWAAIVNHHKVEHVVYDEFSEITETHPAKLLEWLKSQ